MTKPQILLIGDSIRMHYTPLVQQMIQDDAEIVIIKQNGRDSENVKTNLKEWLQLTDSNRLKIIHFNCGLHDIIHPFGSLVNQQPIETYEKNLNEIVSILKEYQSKNQDVKLIWASTTPVNYKRHHKRKSFDRFEEDVRNYNLVAQNIMKTLGIPINDLYSIIMNDSPKKCLKKDGTHYKKRGNTLLANKVSEVLLSNLN